MKERRVIALHVYADASYVLVQCVLSHYDCTPLEMLLSVSQRTSTRKKAHICQDIENNYIFKLKIHKLQINREKCTECFNEMS